MREEKQAWSRRQRRRLRYLAGQIRKDPCVTVEKLKAFGTGLEFIESRSLGGHDLIDRAREGQGYLEPKGLESALLLFGIKPDDASICRNELAYFLTVNALGCLPDQPAPELAKWLEPANRPFPLRNKPREELMGVDGDACRAAIVKRVQEELVPLRELHAQVVREVDEPALLEELQRASILKDEAARRVARCQAEVRATYHRAWRDLVKVLASAEEARRSGCAGDDDGDEDEDKDQEEEAGVAAEAPSEAVVVVDEPAPLSTETDTLPLPAGRGADIPLPDGPERIVAESHRRKCLQK